MKMETFSEPKTEIETVGSVILSSWAPPEAFSPEERRFRILIGQMEKGLLLTITLVPIFVLSILFQDRITTFLPVYMGGNGSASGGDESRLARIDTEFLFWEDRERDISVLSHTYGLDARIPFVKISVSSSDELVEELKKHDLWELEEQQEVPPVIFSQYPQNIDELAVDVKKRLFFHSLLPAVLLVKEEIRLEREGLLAIVSSLNHGGLRPVAYVEELFWLSGLSPEKSVFLESLAVKYRTNDIDELLLRVESVPVSLMLAQAALESSWGASRFTFAGNNLFGMWTWGEAGIIPEKRDADKNHKIAVYDSILSSIRAYVLTLNRLPAYQEFRQIRQRTMDSMDLAHGLVNYSERRTAYVEEVQRIIKQNQLQEYDDLALMSGKEQNANQNISMSRLADADRVTL